MARTANGWNLELMFDDTTRPEIFLRPEGPRTKNGCNSYVYMIVNTQDKMIYIGYHKEGNKLYGTSSTNKVFKELLASDAVGLFEYHILYWGSVEECKQVEYELLTKVDAKNNPKYYNKHNGHPGKKELNMKLVNTLMVELDDFRKHTNLILDSELEYINETHIVEMSVKDLYHTDKWQVRKLEIDHDNLSKIVDRLRNKIGNYDMPVLLKDVTINGQFYELILISGNHTRTAYWKTRDENIGHTENTMIKCLILDEDIHSLMQETEVQMLGNNLNADFNVGKSFGKQDAIDECMEHHKAGHSWKTIGMRQRFMLMGLTSGQVDGVFDKVQDNLDKKLLEDSNQMVYDYEDTHKDLVLKKVARLTNDDVFVIYGASGAPTLDRWMDKYISEQVQRIASGKSVQTRIKVVVYHNTIKNQKNWTKLWMRLTRPQHLDKVYYDEMEHLLRYPEFGYVEMALSGPKIVGKI